MAKKRTSKKAPPKQFLGGISTYGAKIKTKHGNMKLDATTWLDQGMWAEVISSNVKRIWYDRDTKDLFVEFLDKSLYQYPHVAESEARDFFNCKSLGQFVAYRLKGTGEIKVI